MQENPNTNVPMIRMSDVALTEVEWLWYPYLPLGKITILQGNPGEGKTYFGMPSIFPSIRFFSNESALLVEYNM